MFTILAQFTIPWYPQKLPLITFLKVNKQTTPTKSQNLNKQKADDDDGEGIEIEKLKFSWGKGSEAGKYGIN